MAFGSQVPSTSRDDRILISYVGPDLMWAEWISEQLQRAGAMVDVAEWMGGPDAHLLDTLQNAAERYSQCVAVMSSSYQQAVVPDAETGEATAVWAVEHQPILTPVLVRRCELPSRFWQLSPVDLREVTDDRTASRRLLSRVLGLHLPVSRSGETEPMTRFPGRRPAVWSPRMPPRNPYFTGRDEMLRQLRRRLTTDVTALLPHSLQGLSGIGKTQLAIEYAYRFAADYDIVLVGPFRSTRGGTAVPCRPRHPVGPRRPGGGDRRIDPRCAGRVAHRAALPALATDFRQRGCSR